MHSFVENNHVSKDNNVKAHRAAREATYSFECQRVNDNNTAFYTTVCLSIGLFYSYQILKQISNFSFSPRKINKRLLLHIKLNIYFKKLIFIFNQKSIYVN